MIFSGWLFGWLVFAILGLMSLWLVASANYNKELKENYDLGKDNYNLKKKIDDLKDENKNIKEESNDFKIWVKGELKELVKEYKDEGENNTKDNLIEEIKLLIKAIRK